MCLISETHFTKQSHIKFKGYKVYHALHPDNSARGSSAIIVKENLQHFEEFKHEEKDIQAEAICLQTKKYPVTVSAIYCPPRYMIKKDHYMNFLTHFRTRFILGGDFNAKNTSWGSRLTTTKGKELLNAIKELKCDVISTGKPTYWPTDQNKIPDFIDFFITKDLSTSYIKSKQSYDMNSDHSAIYLEISETILYKENRPTLVNKCTDWESYKSRLNDQIDLKVPLKTPEHLNVEVEKFIMHIQQAAWENTPDFNKRTKGNTYPLRIKHLIMEKRKQRKTWHQSRCPEDKRKLNCLTKKVRRLIQDFKDESTKTYLQSLSIDQRTDYFLWKATKHLKRLITQIPPIKCNLPPTYHLSNEQNAKRFAEHLENIFQPNDGEIIEDHTLLNMVTSEN